MKIYSDYNGTPKMKLGPIQPKFPIGTYVVWYNDWVNEKSILSKPYKVLDFEWMFNKEYCYVIIGEDEITEIYESGLFATRENKLKRILNDKSI